MPTADQRSDQSNQLPILTQPSQEQMSTVEAERMPTADRCSDQSNQLPILTQPSQEQINVEVVQCSDQLPMLTNDEVSDVLRGLEETFSVAEVDELLRGLEETLAAEEVKEETSGDHYVDDELDIVMNMDINDFIV